MPAAIPVVGGILGGVFGGRGDQSSPPELTPEEREALETQTEATRMGMGFSEQLFPEAMNWLQRSYGAFSPALSRWSRILSGDRNLIAEELQPEVGAIGSQYSTAMRQAAELSPRSGMRASLMSEIPFQVAGDVGNLYASARPQAATNMATAATNLAGTGQGLLGAASGFLGGATSGAGNVLGFHQGMRNVGLQNAALNQQAGAGWAGGIYEMLRRLPWFGG